MTAADYKPIADYGVIGNLRTAALIGRDGSVDWCCFPHLSSPSVFAALLDARRGGRFRIAPQGAGPGAQAYLPGTNILETTFRTARGQLTVTDFMPLEGDLAGTGTPAAPTLRRLVAADGEALTVSIEWSPRFVYATVPVTVVETAAGILASGNGERLLLTGLPIGTTRIDDDGHGPTLRAEVTLRAGQRLALTTHWGADATTPLVEAVSEELARTAAAWRSWLHKEHIEAREWAGRWEEQLIRSELVLKLLTHADSGAIAAAATTSLPEGIGGVRNWDYRYSWIRDASLVVQALTAVGHREEAHDFLHWAERVSMGGERNGRIQIMYGLHGELDMAERSLHHLEGYRGSRPVRVGNEAYHQRQLDTYGELLGSAYELVRSGETLSDPVRRFLGTAADRAAGALDEVDHGIWEIRGEPRHFVYSKLMLWVALDRALHLVGRASLTGDEARWRAARQQVRDMILREGYDARRGAFVQSFGSDALDTANLMLPIHEFLPFEDPRVQGTIDAVRRELTENGLVYRYLAEDGLPGKEGTFALCTFWLADALTLSGRLDEAQEIFEGMAGRANHLGLFPEQIDPASGEFLGNFPQALTHIGFINSTVYLAHATGRPTPVMAPIGSAAHRRELGRDEAGAVH